MKTAVIRGRRTLADGRHLLNIVCPLCDGRHWVSAASDTLHSCPRRPGEFTIELENKR